MSDTNDYGKNEKRIIFTDTDHRHAQLVLKLKNDGMTKSKFFRCIVSGYLNDDERIKQFVIENSKLSNKRKKRNIKLYNEGKQTMNDLGFSDEQLDEIFDLIAEEHPEL